MISAIAILQADILRQVKLSCQLPSLIEAIVSHKIITSAAAKADIVIETEELQKAADQFRLLNQLQSSEATWAWLQKHDLTVDDLEELVQTTLLSNKLAQHLFADGVEPYFYAHQLDYAGAILYEVVLDDEDLANELYYALVEDEISFPELAQQYIKDKELRRIGGYQGVVHRKNLNPEISAAVFAATPGSYLKPITTSRGIHLILVEEIIQPQLDEKLKLQILSNLFADWLQQQIEQVEISVSLGVSSSSSLGLSISSKTL